MASGRCRTFDMLLYDEHMPNSALDTMTSIIDVYLMMRRMWRLSYRILELLYDAVHDNLDYFTAGIETFYHQ